MTRRVLFDLKKARYRGYILEGLAVALSNIDEVIKTIKKSASMQDAQKALVERQWGAGFVLKMLQNSENMCRPEGLAPIYGIQGELYGFSPEQAKAILDMRLHRLTSLEHEKLVTEYKQLLELIIELKSILDDSDKLLEVIRKELHTIIDTYGDERRSEIVTSRLDLTLEDLISEQDVVVTISHGGYAKTTSLDEYQAQKRGGRGKTAASLKEEDFVEHMLVASTHTQILLFSNKGKVYWLKVYQIPEAGRASRGRPIVNLLPLDAGEQITTVLPVSEFIDGYYVFMATKHGTVKRVPLQQFARPRSQGLIAVGLQEGDTLVGAAITGGDGYIMLITNAGKAICFQETDVRSMGRQACGVRGIRLKKNQRIISLIIPDENATILTVSEAGYGKRTATNEFGVQGRGGAGRIAMVCGERNGEIVGATQVNGDEQIMLMSDQGCLVRTHVAEIRIMGRATKGVRLIRLKKGEKLVGVDRVVETESDDDALDGVVATESDDDALDGVVATDRDDDALDRIIKTESNDDHVDPDQVADLEED